MKNKLLLLGILVVLFFLIGSVSFYSLLYVLIGFVIVLLFVFNSKKFNKKNVIESVKKLFKVDYVKLYVLLFFVIMNLFLLFLVNSSIFAKTDDFNMDLTPRNSVSRFLGAVFVDPIINFQTDISTMLTKCDTVREKIVCECSLGSNYNCDIVSNTLGFLVGIFFFYTVSCMIGFVWYNLHIKKREQRIHGKLKKQEKKTIKPKVTKKSIRKASKKKKAAKSKKNKQVKKKAKTKKKKTSKKTQKKTSKKK